MKELTIEDIEQELMEHSVRPTSTRIAIYRLFSSAEAPLSAGDIEIKLDTVDRSTIGRTLGTMHEAGMLHKIDDGSGIMKYEICRDTHTYEDGSHGDLHPHFYCRKCGRTHCLTNTPLPHLNLPEGYDMEEMNLVISGVCAECNRPR